MLLLTHGVKSERLTAYILFLDKLMKTKPKVTYYGLIHINTLSLITQSSLEQKNVFFDEI